MSGTHPLLVECDCVLKREAAATQHGASMCKMAWFTALTLGAYMTRTLTCRICSAVHACPHGTTVKLLLVPQHYGACRTHTCSTEPLYNTDLALA